MQSKIETKRFLIDELNKYQNCPEEFWDILFKFLEYQCNTYLSNLDNLGFDIEYLDYLLNKSSSDGELQEKVLIDDLVEVKRKFLLLTSIYQNELKKKCEEEESLKRNQLLNKKLQESELRIQNLELLLENERDNNSLLQEQITHSLQRKMDPVREKLRQIPNDVMELEKKGDVLPNALKKRLHTSIQKMYNIMLENKLWSEHDYGPSEINFDKTVRGESVERRGLNRRKNNSQNETFDANDNELIPKEPQTLFDLLEETPEEKTRTRKSSPGHSTVHSTDNHHAAESTDNHAADSNDNRHAANSNDNRHTADSTDNHAADSTDNHAADSTDNHAADSTNNHAADSTDNHAADSTDNHAADSTDNHAADSTDDHAVDSTNILADDSADNRADDSADNRADDSAEHSTATNTNDSAMSSRSVQMPNITSKEIPDEDKK